MSERDCEHGQLARSCNICELEQEVRELRAEVSTLEAAARERRIDRLVELAKGALSGMCAADSEIPTDKLAMYADEIARATLAAIEAGEDGK
jgi:hypothetical protein